MARFASPGVVLASAFLFVGPSCAPRSAATTHLSELPAELAQSLEPSLHGDALVTRPGKALPLVPRDPAGAGSESRERACTMSYNAQAIYPMVVCYPVNQIADVLLRDSPAGSNVDAGPGSATESGAAGQVLERYHRLSSYQGRRIADPLFCRVTGGPWSTVVQEAEQCTGGPNRWDLSVHSPKISLGWYGAWEDMPSYPSLQVVMDHRIVNHQQCSCCPGYAWCPTTKSCIRSSLNCNPPQQ